VDLAAFVADPDGSALLLDIDGTLAPIVTGPGAARVPAETLALVARLAARYALVACVTGRGAADAARMIDLPGVPIAGNHGLELRRDGHTEVEVEARPWLGAIAAAAAELRPVAAAVGGGVDEKGASLAVHFRGAPDPEAAAATIADAAREVAARHGLRTSSGRMVIELVPPIPLDKGTAARHLITASGAVRSLYIGDDTTDIAAFRVVDLAIAVRSEESADALLAAADVVVDGPEGVVAVLQRLDRA
jgi:trehalose 6-phosphate phosphatase